MAERGMFPHPGRSDISLFGTVLESRKVASSGGDLIRVGLR